MIIKITIKINNSEQTILIKYNKIAKYFNLHILDHNSMAIDFRNVRTPEALLKILNMLFEDGWLAFNVAANKSVITKAYYLISEELNEKSEFNFEF